MHIYITNYHTPPTCFDTIVSSPGRSYLVPCQVTQVCQMQLLVIKFKVKVFHIGFMQLQSQCLKSLKYEYYDKYDSFTILKVLNIQNFTA
jgi:hypothetical protein